MSVMANEKKNHTTVYLIINVHFDPSYNKTAPADFSRIISQVGLIMGLQKMNPTLMISSFMDLHLVRACKTFKHVESFIYLYNYIFGKKFVLVTDNKPLLHVFHQNKALNRYLR